MAMDAPTAMPTEVALLTLAQWVSPGFPVGAFSYSHGLEGAANAGVVHDAATLQQWIEDVLTHGAGQADAVFLAASYHAADADAVARIDATARAFAASAERLKETDLQGAAFCKVMAGVWGLELAGLTYPVALGRAAFLCGLPLQATLAMYVQAFAANLVAAGQRLAPVGQSQAQGILRALAPICVTAATHAADGDLDRLTSTSFLADIAAMQHETQYSRMFQT